MENLRKAMPWGAITKLAKKFDVSETQIAKILDGKAKRMDVLDAAEKLIIEDKKNVSEFETRRKSILKAALRG